MKKKTIFLLGILCVISISLGDSGDQEEILTEVTSQAAAMLQGIEALVPVNISKSGGSSESANVVAVDNQRVYVIWVNYGRGKSIQFNTNEGGSWGTPYSVSSGTYVSASGPWPYFAMDTAGHPHLVFTTKFSGDNYEIAHNSYNGQWTGNINVSQTYEGGSACPTIAVNPLNNQRYVCWYDDEGHPDRWELFFKYQSPAGGWSGLKRLPFATSNYTPKMAVDGQGRAHLIWLRRHSGGSFVQYSSNPNPTDENQWTGSFAVSGNTNIDFAEISIAADMAGNVFVVYEQKKDGDYEIFFRMKSAGGGWSSAQNISKTGQNSRWPDVAARNGKAYIVWQEKTNKYQIFFKHYDGGGWTATSDVTNNNYDSIQPSVWVDGSGEIHVVYSDKTTGNYNIWYVNSSSTGGGVPVSAVYPPLNVRLNSTLDSNTGKKKIIVKWKKNSYNDNDAVEKYKVYRKQANQGAGSYSVRATVSKGVYTFEDIGLSSDYKYSYVVTTVDTNGEESEYSNEATEPLVFPPVEVSVNTGLNGTNTKKINTVNWQRNSKNGGQTVKKYIVYRKVQNQGTYQSIGSVGGSTYSFVDQNLPTGKKYAYRLTAVDKGDRECEPSFSGYEHYVFCPIDLNLKTIKNEGMFFSEKINRFKWKDSPLNDPVKVVRYNVYRKKKEEKKSAYVRIFVVEVGTREFWDRDIPFDQKYSYALTATCDNGAESLLSSSKSEQ
jgi:hypothetical protein